jgi:hypothetical protein
MANPNETTVPKFGSFKPRKSAKPNNSPNDNIKSNGKEREVRLGNHRVEKPSSSRTSRSDSHRPRNERSKRQHHQDRNSRHRDRAGSRDNHTLGNQLRDALSRPEQEPFFVDTRGDRGNLQYGRSNKWTLPAYHLYGSGCILGLDPDIKIDRKLSDQSSYTLMYPRNKQPVKVIDLLELDEPLDYPADEEAAERSRDTMTGNGSSENAEMDFVPLPFRETRNDGQCDSFIQCIAHETDVYRTKHAGRHSQGLARVRSRSDLHELCMEAHSQHSFLLCTIT